MAVVTVYSRIKQMFREKHIENYTQALLHTTSGEITTVNGKCGLLVHDIKGDLGQIENGPLYETLMDSHAFVLIFDVTRAPSFQQIEMLLSTVKRIITIREADRHRVGVVLIYIVGNKCDKPKKEVHRDEATRLASQYGCEYVETSVGKGIRSDGLFHSIAANLLRLNKTLDQSQWRILVATLRMCRNSLGFLINAHWRWSWWNKFKAVETNPSPGHSDSRFSWG